MSKINKNLINLGLGTLAILAFSIFLLTPLETNAFTYTDGGFYRSFNTEDTDDKEQTSPKPHISSITPSSIDGVKNKVTITIVGSGFTTDSVVKKNNVNRPTTFIDSNHLLVDIYASDMYNLENFFLTVYNSEPGGGYSNASSFTIKNNNTVNKTTTNSETSSKNTNNINSGTNSNSNTTTSDYDSNSNTSNTNDSVSTRTSDLNESYGSLTANALVGSNSFLPTGFAQWILMILIILAIIFLWRYIHRSEEVYMSEPLKHA